jgi:hypothetical protein
MMMMHNHDDDDDDDDDDEDDDDDHGDVYRLRPLRGSFVETSENCVRLDLSASWAGNPEIICEVRQGFP